MVRRFLLPLLVICGLFVSITVSFRSWHITNQVASDPDSIKARGRLIAITDITSANHVIYKGGSMGFLNNPYSGDFVKSDYSSASSGRVSQWDDLIKLYSESISWDWRLLASLICQESRFIPDVQSKRGAYGLMQVMPETGKYFGIDITSSPGNNIKAGTEYIKWLYSIFDPRIPDEEERTHFILAAYNAGPGHVLDAMNLAKKNGNDPTRWENNVEVWLQKKSDPKYFTDSVVKNGYFCGKESVAFVNEVLGRYQHYKNVIP